MYIESPSPEPLYTPWFVALIMVFSTPGPPLYSIRLRESVEIPVFSNTALELGCIMSFAILYL